MLKEKSIKRGLYVREWIYTVMFLAFALILEMLNFLTLDIGVLPSYIVFDLAVWCIFLGILSLMKPGSVTWICFASFFLVIQVALNITNATLAKVFGDVFSLSMINLGTEGASAFKFEFLDWMSIALNLIVLGGFIGAAIYVRKTTTFGATLTKQGRFTIVLSAFIALQACGLCLFNYQSKNIRVHADEALDAPFSDEDLWENMFLKAESLSKFGTYGFYCKNLGDFLFSSYNMSKADQNTVAQALSAGEYKATSPYSGAGAGDNLIVIMLESFDNFSIDPVYTPFLWKMRTGEFAGAQYLNSFYAKNKTNISEEISILGHIANEKLFSSYESSVGLKTPYSLANLMLNDGATKVNYFHGYTKTFYSRNKVNVALGFQNVYGLEDCTLPHKTKRFDDWILDSEYIKNMSELFFPEDERFFSFYTTISTHGAYDYDNPRIEDNMNYVKEHWDTYVDYAENTANLSIPTNKGMLRKYQQFKAMTMDTDRMVQYIFETLEEKNILDKTTIVMFADHNAYYHDMCFAIKDVSKDEYYNTEANHITALVYNDALPGAVNNTFCNTYDLYPTVCDLLGLTYNESITQGHSIFSDDIASSAFVSSLSGMYVTNIFTSNLVDFIRLDDTVTDEQVETFKQNLLKYFDKQKIIELIYRYNYFGRYVS